MPVSFGNYRLGPGQRVSYKTVPPPWDWLLRRENEPDRGDLGPGSYSLLWFLHSKLRFKRQRLSLHTNSFFGDHRGIVLGNFRLGIVVKRSGPLVISAKPVPTLEKERAAEFYLFLVVPRPTGAGRGVEPEKTPKKSRFQERSNCVLPTFYSHFSGRRPRSMVFGGQQVQQQTMLLVQSACLYLV